MYPTVLNRIRVKVSNILANIRKEIVPFESGAETHEGFGRGESEGSGDAQDEKAFSDAEAEHRPASEDTIRKR